MASALRKKQRFIAPFSSVTITHAAGNFDSLATRRSLSWRVLLPRYWLPKSNKERCKMTILSAFLAGIIVYVFIRVILTGFYIVRPNERAVLTSFGRATRLPNNPPATPHLSDDEHERYNYPAVHVIRPGGPYFKWPWQKAHKVYVSTQAVDLVWDPSKSQTTIEAVTKDNLTTGVNGQIRFRVSESNLYAYLFGVASPLEHVMGYFISILRERIAVFVDPKGPPLVNKQENLSDSDEASLPELSEGVSINDLRKNLPTLNTYMEQQCESTPGRYGVELDAALITSIDPPQEVDRALSAINSTRNQVAADISTAKADSEQQITMSKRAVEIAANNAHAEVAPLKELATTLLSIKQEGGANAVQAYLRNMRIPLLKQTKRIVTTTTNPVK